MQKTGIWRFGSEKRMFECVGDVVVVIRVFVW